MNDATLPADDDNDNAWVDDTSILPDAAVICESPFVDENDASPPECIDTPVCPDNENEAEVDSTFNVLVVDRSTWDADDIEVPNAPDIDITPEVDDNVAGPFDDDNTTPVAALIDTKDGDDNVNAPLVALAIRLPTPFTLTGPDDEDTVISFSATSDAKAEVDDNLTLPDDA